MLYPGHPEGVMGGYDIAHEFPLHKPGAVLPVCARLDDVGLIIFNFIHHKSW